MTKPIRRDVAVCGTHGGVSWHQRHGEPLCDDCRAFMAEYARTHRRHAISDLTGPDLPPFDDSAVCRQIGSEPFFVDKGGNVKPAKAACVDCPWHDPCLEYALEWTVLGIWGGTTAPERETIRDERGIVPFSIITGRLVIRDDVA